MIQTTSELVLVRVIAEYQQANDALRARVAQLEAEVAAKPKDPA